MVTRADIVTFADEDPPPGESPWVAGVPPAPGVEIVDPDPTWPAQFEELAARIRAAIGWRALQLEHVGSTAVPGLAAKPIIDIDLTLADPSDEDSYVPALEGAGFTLTVREPWWHEHRCFRANGTPRCNLHVFGLDNPEVIRHRLFRDWLRGNPDDLALYASIKREAADAANAAGEHVMDYNARKADVLRAICQRAFIAMGLLD